MKIAVVGSREFNDIEFINKTLYSYFASEHGYKKDMVLVSGGARGVDTLAENFIDRMNKSVEESTGWKKFYDKIIYLPDWDKYGKRAGFLRNKLIIENADMVLAFWDGKSKGTKNSIDLAIEKNIPINIYIRNK